VNIVPRGSVPAEDWDGFVKAHPDGWWWHTSHWIDYSLAWMPGSEDMSAAILRADGSLYSVIPLVAQRAVVTHGGQPLPRPLYAGERVPETYRQTYVVDLWDGTEVDMWRRLRRSYKALIHRVEREYDIWIADRNTGAVAVRYAQAIHAEAAGRETRPQATWDLMGQWARDGFGLVALASTPARGWLGMAYAIRWKGWAYWASGATLEDDVQMALQWQLMKTLKCDGETRFYEVGYAAGPEDSEKDRNIAFMKAGLGGVLREAGRYD
jgi:hypothetical protein